VSFSPAGGPADGGHEHGRPAPAPPAERREADDEQHGRLPEGDAGNHDPGDHDAGNHDAGNHDAGNHDAGNHDAGDTASHATDAEVGGSGPGGAAADAGDEAAAQPPPPEDTAPDAGDARAGEGDPGHTAIGVDDLAAGEWLERQADGDAAADTGDAGAVESGSGGAAAGAGDLAAAVAQGAQAAEDAGSDLPDLTDDDALDAALEALLLVVDTPASEELLANTLDQSVARVTEALRRLSAGYTEANRGIDLRRVGEGWRFYTRDAHAPFVEKLLLDGQRAKLTRAALETLAVVAYRQPVTRARVAAVRGVNVDGVIRTLLARGLIEETGADPDTGGILYRTTELFLERLGLSSLEELPPLAPLLPEVDAIDDV
jgi:segregation and condensation protein B